MTSTTTLTAEQRARGVFDFFLEKGLVKEQDRKPVSEGMELAIMAAAIDSEGPLRDAIQSMRAALRQAKDGLLDAGKIGGYGEKCVAGAAFNACNQGIAIADAILEEKS